MNLSGADCGELVNAMLQVYPTKNDLEQMVRFKLDQSLDEIAGGRTNKDIIFNLIEKWAKPQGKLEDLLNAVSQDRPHNLEFQKTVIKLLEKLKNSDEDYDKLLEIQSTVTTIVDIPDNLILWLEDKEVNTSNLSLVGSKNAYLGDIVKNLSHLGINVPTGFVVTSNAYRYFIQSTGLKEKINQILSNLDVHDIVNLQQRGKMIRQLILNTSFPKDLQNYIQLAYQQLCQRHNDDIYQTDVAIRSRITTEDVLNLDFTDQSESFLNVQGIEQVLVSCHKIFASLFTDIAIAYREYNHVNHSKCFMSIGIQKMVRSDISSAGVMFTYEPNSEFKDIVFISGSYGLGETVEQGTVNSDEFLVFKQTLKGDYKPIIEKRLGSKAIQMVYATDDRLIKYIEVLKSERERYCLNDDDILTLAHLGLQLEEYYSNIRDTYTPLRLEWGKDGQTGKIFILQVSFEDFKDNNLNIFESYELKEQGEILATGRSVGNAITQGKARVVLNIEQIELLQEGEVLVTLRIDPDWEPILRKVSAIVTDQGGRMSHAAIIADQLHLPAVVSCGNATETIRTGQEVTVCCCEGEGYIYKGVLSFEVIKIKLEDLPHTHTQIFLQIGNPEKVLSVANTPADGVGLAPLEFIIAHYIKAHPQSLIHFNELENELIKHEIAELTHLYENKADFFVDKLASGIGMIAAGFYPKPVIVRFSDFKSNEYACLLGGRQFEPMEENPMSGWRGASRYYDPNYQDAFALECKAMKKVRDEMGLTNIIPMIPFCRTQKEGQLVLAEMAKNGLNKGVNGLQVYLFCVLPSNVILANEFSEIFDGFCIGLNGLTQSTLQLDRDSALVAHLFDECNQAVKQMIKIVVKAAKAKGRKIGVLGEAPSEYPEFLEFLVKLGIDFVGLNPTSVVKTRLMIANIEADQ